MGVRQQHLPLLLSAPSEREGASLAPRLPTLQPRGTAIRRALCDHDPVLQTSKSWNAIGPPAYCGLALAPNSSAGKLIPPPRGAMQSMSAAQDRALLHPLGQGSHMCTHNAREAHSAPPAPTLQNYVCLVIRAPGPSVLQQEAHTDPRTQANKHVVLICVNDLFKMLPT